MMAVATYFVQPGEPRPTDRVCPSCSGTLFEVDVLRLSDSGVTTLGVLTGCAHCGYRERGRRL